MVYIDRSVEAGAVFEINLSGWNVGIEVKLVVEEAADELWESRLTNMNSKIFDCPWITSFWGESK